MDIKDLRWQKIKNIVPKIEEMKKDHKIEQWSAVIPSPSGGFDIVSLPIINPKQDIKVELELTKLTFNDMEAAGKDPKKYAMTTLNLIFNKQFGEALACFPNKKERIHATHCGLWSIIVMCENSVEFFEENRIVFIDVNLVELPSSKEKRVLH